MMKTQEKYLQLKFKNYFTANTSYELSNLHPQDSTQTTLLLKSSLKSLCYSNDVSPNGSVVFAPLGLSQRLQFPVQNVKNQRLLRFAKPVSDICFNPCTSDLWAVSEDVRIHVMTSQDPAPQMSLELDKKLTVLQFNPVVEQVLAAGAIDNSLRAIDIQKEKESINLTLSGKVTSLEWRQDAGSLVAAQQNGSKRQFIMVDIRQGHGLELEMKGTQAISKLAVCWIGNEELMTIVNEAEQERRMMLWDIRKMEEPLFEEVIDTNPGQTYPFYDNETKLLYLTSKGQKSILVYEYLNHEFMHLNFSNGAKQYEGTSPGYGYSLLPKALIDKKGDEFNRMLIMQAKQNKEKIVTEISFKQTKFNYLEQFPEYNADEPSLQKEQWYSGNNSNPIKLSFLNKEKVIPKSEGTQPIKQVQQSKQNQKEEIVIEKVQEEKKIPQEIAQPIKEDQEDLKEEVSELKNEVKDIKDQIQELTDTVKYLKDKLEILTNQ